MFLTTNRVEVIDPAFKSRIHLPIAYAPFSRESRCQLWTTFISIGTSNRRPQWLDDKFLDDIGKEEINGRQIKNAVRVAHALAQNDCREMMAEDIYSAIQTLRSFEDDFRQSRQDSTGEPFLALPTSGEDIAGSSKPVAVQAGFQKLSL